VSKRKMVDIPSRGVIFSGDTVALGDCEFNGYTVLMVVELWMSGVVLVSRRPTCLLCIVVHFIFGGG